MFTPIYFSKITTENYSFKKEKILKMIVLELFSLKSYLHLEEIDFLLLLLNDRLQQAKVSVFDTVLMSFNIKLLYMMCDTI